MFHNKWVLSTIILAIALTKTLNSSFLPVGKSKLINKTTTLKFFKPNKKKYSAQQMQEPIAIIRYSWTPDHTTLHLDLFKIGARKHRKKGLGKQLFTYFVAYIQKTERKATTISWTAQALDPEHMSQETLEKFYTSLGGTKLYSETCKNPECTCESPTTSEFSLEIKDFIPADISSLNSMDIVEESDTTRVKTLALADQIAN